MLKGVNEFAKKNFAGEDVREGILGAVAIKLQDPVFESQTKNKLGSTEVRSWIVPAVKKQVVLWLHQNSDEASRLLEKVALNETTQILVEAYCCPSRRTCKLRKFQAWDPWHNADANRTETQYGVTARGDYAMCGGDSVDLVDFGPTSY